MVLTPKVSKLESSVPIVEEWGLKTDKALVTSLTNQGLNCHRPASASSCLGNPPSSD